MPAIPDVFGAYFWAGYAPACAVPPVLRSHGVSGTLGTIPALLFPKVLPNQIRREGIKYSWRQYNSWRKLLIMASCPVIRRNTKLHTLGQRLQFKEDSFAKAGKQL